MDEKDNVSSFKEAKQKKESSNKGTGTPKNGKRADSRFTENEKGMAFISEDARNGIQTKQLCDFTMRIVAEIVKDNGQEQERLIEIEGKQNGTVFPIVSITYDCFSAMNWPAKHWGTSCVIAPGMGVKDQLRCAVQTLSHADETRPVARRTVYAHTGWRQINGAWHYFHLAGTINARGLARDITVQLEGNYQYSLPAPSLSGHQRAAAAAASLAILDMAPWEVTLPLLACVYLAPLASPLRVDFVAWLEAASKSQKSTMAGIALAHWGETFDRNTLTASWNDTAFSLETSLFELKDALAVVDDYAPQATATAQAKLDDNVSKVVRSCGNLSGRGRGGSDMKLRPARPPRGLVISTAEQCPLIESINARLFAIPVERDKVDLAAISRSQAAASQGLLARAMANYLFYMAKDYETTVTGCRAAWLEYRKRALDHGLTGRVPDQVAFLQIGVDLATRYFRDCALPADAIDWLGGSFDLFMRLGASQAARAKSVQPAERFRETLLDLLASGAAHLVPLDAGGDTIDGKPTAHGVMIGWRRGEHELCLLKVETLAVVSEALRRAQSTLGMREHALLRELRERKWLQLGDKAGEGTYQSTRTVKILGKATRVLVFDERDLKT